MRGPALQNSMKTATPAHLWPLKMDENCDALRFGQGIAVLLLSTRKSWKFR
jgi:hypothetical protein